MSEEDWCCLTDEVLKDMATELLEWGPSVLWQNHPIERVERFVRKSRGCVSLKCDYHAYEIDLDILEQWLDDAKPDGPECSCRAFCKECV